MKEADNERTVSYGLRLRRGGEILRVESRSEMVNDFGTDTVETTYSLGTDSEQPYFVVSSPEELALLFASSWPGKSRYAPHMGGYKPGDLEPVVIEEVVSRRIRAADLAFEIPAKVDARYRIDVYPSYAGEIEGLGPVFEAFDACKDDLLRVPYLGSTHGWGKVNLMGLVVAGAPADQPDGVPGGIVRDGEGGNDPCRALAVLPLPDGMRHLLERRGRPTPAEGTLVITLNDKRPLPESLVRALADISPDGAPRP